MDGAVVVVVEIVDEVVVDGTVVEGFVVVVGVWATAEDERSQQARKALIARPATSAWRTAIVRIHRVIQHTR